MKKPILSSLFPVAMLALSLSVDSIAATDNFTFIAGGTGTAIPALVPDGGGVGVVNTQTPATSIIVITGLTIRLDIGSPIPADPAFNGDLYAYVRLDTTNPLLAGFTVLLNRTGVNNPGDPFGYANTGFNVTFDDAAANGDIHIYQSGAPVFNGAGQLTGTWQPDGRNVAPDDITLANGTARTAGIAGTNPPLAALSSFIGLNPQSTWNLYVEDLSGGGSAVINSWGLDITGLTSTFWYWKGATNNMWNAIGTAALPNWTTDAAGTTQIPAVPFNLSDVIFSASGATNQNTVLGADFTIHSLTINDTAAVTIGGANTLTIAGNAGTGVDVQAGAGLLTINANLTLAGASDTITVNNAAGAVINGTVGGSNGLIKAGTGTLTLTSGASTYSGGTTLNVGRLNVDASSTPTSGGPVTSGPLGTGPLTINGGTLGTNVGSTELANPITVNGNFSVAPPVADDLYLNGDVTLTGTRTITSQNSGSGTHFSGAISGGAAGLTLADAQAAPDFNRIYFEGTTPNTYTGLTTLETNADLHAAKSNGVISIAGDLLIKPGGGLVIDHDEQIADTSTVTVNSTGIAGATSDHTGILMKGHTETIGSLFGNGTVALDNKLGGAAGTLTVGAGDFSGVISDSNKGNGKFIKNTVGTVTLTGANTYTSPTDVKEGTLAIDNDGVTKFGSLTSSHLFVKAGAAAGENGGHLFYLNAATTAGHGNITVDGPTVAGAGNGTVEFFNNSSAGSIFIGHNASVIAGAIGGSTIFHDSSTAGSAGLIASGSPVAGAFGSKIAFHDTSDAGSAFLGGTGGAGGGGGGSLYFFGASTGGTSAVTVNGNGNMDISLHNAPGVGIGSLSGSGNVFLGANTLTVGSRNNSPIFSGVLQDGGAGGGTGGSLTKVGTGTLILTGANTYTGTTTLNTGTLAAGNAKAFSSANLTMTGGTLKTTGPLVVDIGAGNILFTGGTYSANVGGLLPAVQHDQLKTTGTASVTGGTIALVQQNGFTLAPGQQVVLATAAGGVAGSSANGTSDPNVTGLSAFSTTPLLTPTVNLYPTSVILEVTQGSFAALKGTLGFTPNQLSVATGLDSVSAKIGNKTGVFSELTFLDTQSLTTLAGNLDKISPDELTAIFTIAVSLANIQATHIQNRTAAIRDEAASIGGVGGGGVSAGGGAPGPVGKRGKEIRLADEERWGMWFTGAGEFTHVGSTTNAAGFNTETGGVTAGVDYRFTDHFAAGISLGYMNTNASLVNGGKVDVDGGRVGLYATYFDRGFYLDAAVSGGFNSYDTRRITPNNTAATGKPEGSEINVLFATGYDWKWKGLTLGPTASIQYTNVQLDGFTETGGFAPLRFATQSADSVRSALGFHATFDKKVGRAIIRPEVRAAWQHEFGDTSYSLTSSFATLGGNAFTVAGPETGRDSLLVGAGLSVLFNERFSIYAYYDGELLRANYSSHNVSAGFRYRF
jgi:outer membrane autotransporter protein